MSDAILVALINSITVIATIILGRWMSYREHKSTAADVKEIKRIVNGGKPAE